MTFYQSIPWHSGEERMRNALHVPINDNPTVPALSPQLSRHLQIAPLIAVGTLDSSQRPWTTLWGGRKALAQALGGDVMGIKTEVAKQYDPVVEELIGKEVGGEIQREEGKGRMVSGVTMDLNARKRVKFYGRMVAGALGSNGEGGAEVQLVLRIEQSLGNCPKYLNCKTLEPAESVPRLLHSGPHLSQEGLDLLDQTDLFFISSSNKNEDMDTNHRGGPAGFIRTIKDNPSGTVIYLPEYSGNRLYQTLGNLLVNPLAGLCVPNFTTGDVLYLTGSTEILIAEAASQVLPRSNLVVKFTVSESRFVATALPFRGVPGELSPYNPAVRLLAVERPSPTTLLQQRDTTLPKQTAALVSQTKLTPTISRYKFCIASSLSQKATWAPGQYVTLDFSSDLDLGYSHMRDDDPLSINDDFLRTFTVSSRHPDLVTPTSIPSPGSGGEITFDITIRNVGTVTRFLSTLLGSDRGMPLELDIKGFGGEFSVSQSASETRGIAVDPAAEDVYVIFIAAGVGITPILPSLSDLDMEKLRVLWTVRAADVAFVLDVLRQNPGVAPSLAVCVTGAGTAQEEESNAIQELQAYAGVQVYCRRMETQDVGKELSGEKSRRRFYVCTGVEMRKDVLRWLEGEEVVYEDFNF